MQRESRIPLSGHEEQLGRATAIIMRDEIIDICVPSKEMPLSSNKSQFSHISERRELRTNRSNGSSVKTLLRSSIAIREGKREIKRRNDTAPYTRYRIAHALEKILYHGDAANNN